MSNKHYPGNDSFTISLTELWYFSVISYICHKISEKTSRATRLDSLVTKVDQPGTCGDI